jgi:hypothetical protein
MWGRPYRARTEGPDSELVDECSLFLNGTYALAMDSDGLPVPGWAWLNLLAHGSPAIVRGLADEEPTSVDRGDTRWRSATSLLAVELLAASERTGRSLGELQRILVFRLEVEPTEPAIANPAAPAELVQTVRGLLGRMRGIPSN